MFYYKFLRSIYFNTFELVSLSQYMCTKTMGYVSLSDPALKASIMKRLFCFCLNFILLSA